MVLVTRSLMMTISLKIKAKQRLIVGNLVSESRVYQAEKISRCWAQDGGGILADFPVYRLDVTGNDFGCSSELSKLPI